LPSRRRRRPRLPRRRALLVPSPSGPASAGPAASAFRSPWPLFVDLLGVERLLDQRDEVVLACRLLVVWLGVAAVRSELERERQPAAGHLVERVGEQCRVLRLLRELAVERRVAWKLERQRVVREPGRLRLAEDRRGRNRLLLHCREDGALPGL